ncbi:MAG: glycosyl hydrolase [Gemmataceae bacterium]|jgi:hypothetical protein|nr:MAG: glycosyl hydrolase [Gemmataceae bacterium]
MLHSPCRVRCHRFGSALGGLCLLAVALMTVSAPFPSEASADTAVPQGLTHAQAAEGWLLLFDGQTAFGWDCPGKNAVREGVWHLEEGSTAWPFSRFGNHWELVAEVAGPVRLYLPHEHVLEHRGDNFDRLQVFCDGEKIRYEGTGFSRINAERPAGPPAATIGITAPGPQPARLRHLRLRPQGLQPLWNGRNLNGWTVNTADPKRQQARFRVTDQGELLVEGGPGDLVSTVHAADFVLQFDCRTLGKHLNSGVFFRCIPGQYQNGYEVQIHNGYKNNDRTQPLDFGTGAIYRRAPARRVVSNDEEWFTVTLIADGRRIATWVNGFPVVAWEDPRPPHDNPRQGYRAAAGPFSIQAHDPTTRLLFRRIQYAPLHPRPNSHPTPQLP